MLEPTFDRDGYPTEATLERVQSWPLEDDLEAGVRFIQQAWSYPERFVEVKPGVWYVSTGGWSGNEDLIAAWRRNFLLWSQWFVLHGRGGHFIFARGDMGDGACFCNLEKKEAVDAKQD